MKYTSQGKTIAAVCSNCGKEKQEFSSTLKKRQSYTCSRECLYQYNYKNKNIFHEQGLKLCIKCKEHKPLSLFGANKSMLDRKSNYCLSCCKIYDSNRSKIKVEKGRNRVIKRLYGISEAQYEYMVALQSGKCKICKTSDLGRYDRLVIDHYHINGNVRGLLCNNCNTGLGLFKDSIDNLNEAINYLKNAKN